jgi:hypothetical protein
MVCPIVTLQEKGAHSSSYFLAIKDVFFFSFLDISEFHRDKGSYSIFLADFQRKQNISLPNYVPCPWVIFGQTNILLKVA